MVDGLIPGNVAKGVQPPRGEVVREPVFLTRAELEQITAALPPCTATLVDFLAGTGLRFGEATALRGADLTLPDAASAGAGDGGGRGVVPVSKAGRPTRPQTDGSSSVHPRPSAAAAP